MTWPGGGGRDAAREDVAPAEGPGVGFRVCRSRFRVAGCGFHSRAFSPTKGATWVWDSGSGVGVQGKGFRVWGLGFRVWGLGFRVWGLNTVFGVWGFQFRF